MLGMSDRRARIKAILGEAASRKQGLHGSSSGFNPWFNRFRQSGGRPGMAGWPRVAFVFFLLSLFMLAVELIKWSLPLHLGIIHRGIAPAIWFLVPGLIAALLGAVRSARARRNLPPLHIDMLPEIILRSPRWWGHVFIMLGTGVLIAQVIVLAVFGKWTPIITDFGLSLPAALIGFGAVSFLQRALRHKRFQ